MTWIPRRDDAAAKAEFIRLYGEDLWNQIQEINAPKPLSAREVFKPRAKPTTPASEQTNTPPMRSDETDPRENE